MKLPKLNIDRLALVEALKEVLRYGALGIVSYLLTGGVDLILGAITLDPQTRLMVSGVVLSGLRAIDKYLHQVGKNTSNETLVKGLTRF